MNCIRETAHNKINEHDEFCCFHSYISLDSSPIYRSFSKCQLNTNINLKNGLRFHGEDPRLFTINDKNMRCLNDLLTTLITSKIIL